MPDIQIAAQKLCTDLADALSAKDQRFDELRLTFFYESGQLAHYRRIPKPIHTLRSIQIVVESVVSHLDFQSPVMAVSLVASGVSSSRMVQHTLTGGVSPQARNLAAEHAYRRVKTVYGDTALRLAKELPVERRKAVLKAWEDATGWR